MTECRNRNFWELTFYDKDNPHLGLCLKSDQVQNKSKPLENKKLTVARSSVPDDLEIRLSSIENAGMGIFALDKIPKGTVFGPYEGIKIDADSAEQGADASYMWEIVEDGTVTHIIDGKDENESNWMRFINCARFEKEQNLEAYQFENNIFYETYREIEAGTELLVWYGNQYAANLGIKLSRQSQMSNDSSSNSSDWSDDSYSSYSTTSESDYLSSGDEWCPSQEMDIETSEPNWHSLHPKMTRSYKMQEDSILNQSEDSFASDKPENHSPSIKDREKEVESPSKQTDCCVIISDDSDCEPIEESTTSASTSTPSNERDSSLKGQICNSLTTANQLDKCVPNDKNCGVIVIEDSDDSDDDGPNTTGLLKRSTVGKDTIKAKKTNYLYQNANGTASQTNTIDRYMKQRGKRQESMIICNLNTTNKMSKNQSNNKCLYICVKCEKCFSSKEEFRKHEAVHFTKKIILCCDCGKRFDGNQIRKGKRYDNKPFTCRKCKTKKKTSLNKKLSKKTFQCELCRKSFPRIYNLKRHQQTHNSKQYGNNLNEVSPSKVLKQMHFETQSYKCCLCEQKYSQLQCLKGHKKMPQNGLVFYCSTCNVELIPTEDELMITN